MYKEFGQGDNFPGMSLIPEKMEWARLQGLNSKSFEFNSNGLNRKWPIGRSKNVEDLGGALISGKRIMGKVREPKFEEGKAKGFSMHVCCGKFQINGI